MCCFRGASEGKLASGLPVTGVSRVATSGKTVEVREGMLA